ncbi:MAG: hypothetical protein QM674_19955 [Burkholderiaceae bacterium]
MPESDSIVRDAGSRLPSPWAGGEPLPPGISALIVMRPSASEATMRALLARVGVTSVAAADSVEDGLQCLQARHFDILACEQDLGDGGLAHHLCDEARRQGWLRPSTLIVVISRARTTQSVMSVAEFEPDCCLLRPLTSDDSVERLVRAWLHKRAFDPLFNAMAIGDATAVDLQAQLIGSSNSALQQTANRIASEWLLHAGELAAAESFARRALNVGTPAWALCRLAQIRVTQGRLGDASVLLQRAIDANPRHLDSLELLSVIREREGRPAEALATLDRLTAQLDPSTQRMRRTGKLARQTGDLHRAEAALRWIDHHSREGSPESIEDRAELIEVLQAQGRDHAASSLHAMQAQRLKDHPDAPLLAAIFEADRLPRDADPAVRQAAGERMLALFEQGSDVVSIATALRAVHACLRAGLRQEGFLLAAAISRCRRADQHQLDTLRETLTGLGALPADEPAAM